MSALSRDIEAAQARIAENERAACPDCTRGGLGRPCEAHQYLFEKTFFGERVANRTVVLCPSCGGQDWSVEYRVKVAVPAILRLLGMTVEVKDTMIGKPPVPASCVEAFACACGYTIDPAENYFRCHRDGRLVLAGDCCAACGVHYSEACDTCGQAGYHADGCDEIDAFPVPVSENVEGRTVLTARQDPRLHPTPLKG